MTNGTGQLGQTRRQLNEMPRLDHQLQMPAQFFHAVGIEFEIFRRQAAGMRHDEAHAADAALFQRVQFCVSGFLRHGDDGAEWQADLGNAVELTAVVELVDAGLNRNDPFDAERVEMPARHLRRRIGRRVFAIGIVGIFLGRSEQMKMCIGRPRRRFQTWRPRREVGSLAQFGHRHSPALIRFESDCRSTTVRRPEQDVALNGSQSPGRLRHLAIEKGLRGGPRRP